ncbi:hypothetical protein OG195_05070 [Streptomyces sp. NBC_01362]
MSMLNTGSPSRAKSKWYFTKAPAISPTVSKSVSSRRARAVTTLRSVPVSLPRLGCSNSQVVRSTDFFGSTPNELSSRSSWPYAS